MLSINRRSAERRPVFKKERRYETMKKLLVMLLAALLLLSSTSALACTGLYVGKQVSQDGSTIIARTVDTHPCLTPSLEIVVDRVENTPGRTLTGGRTGFSYPLPDTTYKYTSTPFASCAGGGYASAAVNEMGVAVTATVTAYIQSAWNDVDPMNYDTGLTEYVAADLIASCAATAREGVEVVAKAIELNGNAEQNIIMIADQNEAWYIETYTGTQWCAVKMPEDMVAVFGNQFMLQGVDPDSQDVMHSEGLFTLAEEAGLAVYDEDGAMNLFNTYSGTGRLANYGNRRTWMGHVLLAPSTAGEYDTYTNYPLFYAPDEKVGLEDIFELFRNRFEGTQWAPDETGRVDQRVIGTETQAMSHVIQVFDGVPAEISCVSWQCMANAEHSVYLPVSGLITDTAAAYAYNPDHEEIIYDPDMASVCFQRLCSLAEQDREYYGTGVRQFWHEKELSLIESYPEVYAEMARLYGEDPQAAAQYITDWTVALQEETLEQCNLMFDELMLYMMNNTDTLKNSFSYSRLTLTDTITQTPFVPSLLAVEE